MKVGISYAVMIGANDTKDFRKLSRAKAFSKRLAEKTGNAVEIDKIESYPWAKPGETDWSQSMYGFVLPRLAKVL